MNHWKNNKNVPEQAKDANSSLQRWLSTCPFLEYSTGSLFIHAERAETGGIAQEHLVDDSDRYFHRWRFLFDLMKPKYQCHGPNPTILHIAAGSKLLSCVRRLIEDKEDLNKIGGYFGTALQAAAATGHLEMASVLLKGGAAVNVQAGNYGTAIQAASAAGQKPIMILLYKHGADIHAQGGWFGGALHAAAEAGHEDVAKWLLDNGARVNMTADFGPSMPFDRFAPLHFAALRGHKGITRLLIRKGADVELPVKRGEKPLYVAAEAGHEAVVRLLLGKGADPIARIKSFGTLTFFTEFGNPPVENCQGFPAIHRAAQKGHRRVIQTLFEAGVSPEVRDDYGSTPLPACYFL